MTAILDPAYSTLAAVPLGWIGRPRLLAGTRDTDLTGYTAHLAVHGEPVHPELARLLAELDAVTLTGRGGAAFPLAVKLRSLAAGRPVVVVNGTEGEPASAKDHLLLTRTPHLVLDGAAAVAQAVRARRVLVAVTSREVVPVLRRAVASRPDADLFELREIEDRFIAGEARALISALNGGAAVPPGRRTLPTVAGVEGRPTVLSNAETYAQLAVLLRLGADRYAEVGSGAERGTTLITVTGAVGRPGVLEVPFGTTLGEVADVVAALPTQAVVVGGYHGAWLPYDPSLQLSRAALAARGGTLGAGAVVFVGQHTCALGELARVAQWLADESAKNCGPCAFGLPALAEDVRQLAGGRPTAAALERHARLVTGRGACAHPDGAARFVTSGLAVLAEEVALHHAHGTCHRLDRGHLTLSRAAAFDGTVN